MLSRTVRPIAVGIGLVGLSGALAGCSTPVADHSYNDGLYSAIGKYTSPGGPQGINVAVEIQDDMVKWVMVTPRTYVGEPAEFQSRFAEAVPDEVIGKDIDLIAVSRIAGSSLTSTAFNQALAAIKTEAVEH